MSKTYEIEIINWVWQEVKTRNDMFYFAKNSHPRVKKFRSQKAAREWLESQSFRPIFNANRPSIYLSENGGMQATIYERNCREWTKGSFEGHVKKYL